MTSFQRLLSILIVGVSASSLTGCAVEAAADGEDAVASEADELRVEFTKLDIKKSGAADQVNVLRNKGEFREFFGFNPPASVDFNREWVIHFSTGVKSTGGHSAEITGVDIRRSRLTVFTNATSPGAGCMVTQAFTNPQMTVKIARKSGVNKFFESRERVAKDCRPVCPSPSKFCDDICAGRPTETFPDGCPQPMCACPEPEPQICIQGGAVPEACPETAVWDSTACRFVCPEPTPGRICIQGGPVPEACPATAVWDSTACRFVCPEPTPGRICIQGGAVPAACPETAVWDSAACRFVCPAQ